MSKKNIDGLTHFHKERSSKKAHMVELVISQLLAKNEPINVNIVALKAKVSRQFIYQNKALLAKIKGNIELSQERNANKVLSLSSNKALESKVKTLTEHCKKLTQENKYLKDEVLGLQQYIEELRGNQ